MDTKKTTVIDRWSRQPIVLALLPLHCLQSTLFVGLVFSSSCNWSVHVDGRYYKSRQKTAEAAAEAAAANKIKEGTNAA